MSTTYHPYKIALTGGQKKKLKKAYVTKTAVNLKVKPDKIGRGDELFLTDTQISRLKKTSAAGKGMVIKLRQTQIQRIAQRGGSLFSAMLGLAKPALGALASAGLSFGAEKVLKKIFGKGYGPKEIELYKLVQRMTPTQKKVAERYLVGQGFVQGGSAQYGGFLGMLASIGVPLALDLVRKIIGKGLQTQPPRSRSRRAPPLPPPPKGKGMQIRPPPFFGTWDDYLKKKIKFEDKPLSNIDLRKWCNFLRIPIKGIFSRNETKPLFHSPCIINLDDFGSLGTHWVCCWRAKNGTYEYFDSFGFPPPLEWEKEMSIHGIKHFFRNNNQIQWERSVRCGYYCLLFLNERNKGTSFVDILKMFSKDFLENEEIVKNYFS